MCTSEGIYTFSTADSPAGMGQAGLLYVNNRSDSTIQIAIGSYRPAMAIRCKASNANPWTSWSAVSLTIVK